jgi:hemerythrin
MSNTNCVFRWTDIYKVNVALLDQQHQGLFDTVNELERAMRAGEGNAVIDGILDRFDDLCRIAFRRRRIVDGAARLSRTVDSQDSA